MKRHLNLQRKVQNHSRGFSTLELLVVMVISLIIAALSIPGFNQARRALRISGDGRDLNGAINQAKLHAAADFTRARVYFDLGGAGANTFHIDVWNKAGNGGAGCWQVVNDPNPCLLPGTTPPSAHTLSPGVNFGFAGVGAPPPNTQAGVIQQAPPGCFHPFGNGLGIVPRTACIEFNSRGFPIFPPTGVPTGNDSVYITDNTVVYGVTVGGTGMSQVWATSANGNANWYRK